MEPTDALQVTRSWPTEARLQFALQLWDELIEEDWQPEPDEELAAEIERRLDAHEANPTNIRTAEQVWERIRGRQ